MLTSRGSAWPMTAYSVRGQRTALANARTTFKKSPLYISNGQKMAMLKNAVNLSKIIFSSF